MNKCTMDCAGRQRRKNRVENEGGGGGKGSAGEEAVKRQEGVKKERVGGNKSEIERGRWERKVEAERERKE